MSKQPIVHFLVTLPRPEGVSVTKLAKAIREAVHEWGYNSAVGFEWDEETDESRPGPLHGFGAKATVKRLFLAGEEE